MGFVLMEYVLGTSAVWSRDLKCSSGWGVNESWVAMLVKVPKKWGPAALGWLRVPPLACIRPCHRSMLCCTAGRMVDRWLSVGLLSKWFVSSMKASIPICRGDFVTELVRDHSFAWEWYAVINK